MERWRQIINRRFIIISLLICIAIVALAAAFASSFPDGLEWVAAKLGFENKAAETNIVQSPMPDYSVGLVKAPFWSTLVSGILGTAAAFVATIIIIKIFRRRSRQQID